MNKQGRGRVARRRHRGGFTLVEVLIALVILAIGIAAVMKLFPTSLRQARVAAERTVVSKLATDRMGRLRSAGADNLLANRTGFQLRWTGESVQQIHELYESWETTVNTVSAAEDVALQRVTFSVKLPDGRREKFLTYISRQ